MSEKRLAVVTGASSGIGAATAMRLAKDGAAVGVYPPHDPLLSGWLVGREKIADKAALVEVPVGAGRAVLMGFRVHFRAQARGTYKILFNAILRGRRNSRRRTKPA